MKKIGNINVSIVHGYAGVAEGQYDFGIRCFGGHSETRTVHILLGVYSIHLEWSKRLSLKNPKYEEMRSMKWFKRYSLAGLTFFIEGNRYTKLFDTFRLGIHYGYAWEDRIFDVDLGLCMFRVEWQVRLTERWRKRERQECKQRVEEYLKSEGLTEGTEKYSKELAKSLKEHDEFMAKSIDERYEEMVRDYEDNQNTIDVI